MRWLAFCLLFVACKSDPDVTPVADTGVEEDDAAIVVPPLDPAKCGSVEGDEAPMVLDRAFVPAIGDEQELGKAFPLFAELGARADLLDRLRKDPTLSALAAEREKRLADAKSCADWACVAASVAYTADQRATAADAVVTALGDASSAFVDERLRKSGRFNVDASLDDAALLRKAVIDELRWAEAAIAEGDALDATSRSEALSLATRPSPNVFYEPTLSLGLAMLSVSKRDEAVRYEPLATGENAAAIAAIATTDWNEYPFAAIVVPGLGPSDADPVTALTEGGRQRCDLAAARFRAGIAPFILPSGGHVHPDRTKYSEAMEMKKYLVSIGIPASAILVDPHARHTTTNLRHASRLLLRYGAPPDRPVIVTSDPFQSLYMIGAPFAQRCRDEIGHVPWRKLVSLSMNDTCLRPSRVALSIDARDPLDP